MKHKLNAHIVKSFPIEKFKHEAEEFRKLQKRRAKI